MEAGLRLRVHEEVVEENITEHRIKSSTKDYRTVEYERVSHPGRKEENT